MSIRPTNDNNNHTTHQDDQKKHLASNNTKKGHRQRPLRSLPSASSMLGVAVAMMVTSFGLGMTVQRHWFVVDTATTTRSRKGTASYHSSSNDNTTITTITTTTTTIYGHIHMAKTGGTTLNGILALHYERVCGHKGYSYDAVQHNQRVQAFQQQEQQQRKGKSKGKKTKAGALYGLEDSMTLVKPKYNRGRVPPSVMMEIGFENCDYISLEDPGWKAWAQHVLPALPLDAVLEWHLPCRDVIDHFLSQCHFARHDFRCDPNMVLEEEEEDDNESGQAGRRLQQSGTSSATSTSSSSTREEEEEGGGGVYQYLQSTRNNSPKKETSTRYSQQQPQRRQHSEDPILRDEEEEEETFADPLFLSSPSSSSKHSYAYKYPIHRKSQSQTLTQQIESCLVGMNRFHANLTTTTTLPYPNRTRLKCFDYRQQDAYLHYMSARLQPKRQPPHLLSNKADHVYVASDKPRRPLQDECLLQAKHKPLYDKVEDYLMTHYHYYPFCQSCMGTEHDLLQGL